MHCRMLVSDLDGTLLGNPESGALFTVHWNLLDAGQRPLLVYNTGRLFEDARRVIQESGFPEPDFFICGVGTLIQERGHEKPLRAFHEILEEAWNADQVRDVMQHFPATLQPRHFQTRYKVSYYWEHARETDLAACRDAFRETGLEVDVVYSSARDLDVLPRCANKGNALSWLLRERSIPAESVIAAGDSGNDSAMLNVPGVKGIVVENAQPELLERTVAKGVTGEIFRASLPMTEGVLEGLVHFGVLESMDPRPFCMQTDVSFEPAIQHLVDEESGKEFSSQDQALLIEGRRYAVEALERCITPLGFSACSIADNLTRGTDANYHSVWARDGAITVWGTLQAGELQLQEVQRQTLDTLISGISPNGQFPANVRVEDGEPDYSGVGGICSIDSGLWIIIAFYEYVHTHRDHDFLRKHRGALQRAMNWLSAHDSNNDGLLEIPEAGDWTDLFGRSYNVLYDEVLWYRANVCYGRLMELAGEERLAEDYLRWSGSIKSAILMKFWPATQDRFAANLSFADKQYSLGDTQYLLAQVTPFGFDWRCDVLGNVLAFLFNVLDPERANIAFRFMWGVGVNEPYPAANLYPVVDAGDPMWKEYYTVNLLNLPHHYHNGGIWPFVGGFWVRFIHRLGLTDLARQELLRLTELNRLGVTTDWEFNEWAHGGTGKPMGKRFQAWSCSEYLAAHQTVVGRSDKSSA